jgi:hypothetical protein
MPDRKPILRRPVPLAIAVVIVVLFALMIVGIVVTQAAPPQPFPYTHAPHIELGTPCVYCHSAAYRSRSAGLPTKQKCMGCHDNMKAETPLLKQLAVYAREHATFEWTPVALLPDFVRFNHQLHVVNGQLDCATCHGDVAHMADAQPQKYWDMGWCLDCHSQSSPDQYARLSDCSTCHY